jgi:ribosomal-protein-alanine N-acetyltransferase
MPGPFVIRQAIAADHEAMFLLDHLCFEEPFRFTWSAMRRFATQPNAIALVSDRQGADGVPSLAGIVIVHVERGDRSAYLVTLDVHPAVRRQGLARLLIEEAERRALATGARRMVLHVWVGNDAAIRFYERRGYVQQTLEKHLYADGVDAWTYAKVLS